MESNITQETSTTEWDFRSFRLNCFHISYLIQIMLVWCSIGACNLSAWRGELLFMYLVAASFSECLRKWVGTSCHDEEGRIFCMH